MEFRKHPVYREKQGGKGRNSKITEKFVIAQ